MALGAPTAGSPGGVRPPGDHRRSWTGRTHGAPATRRHLPGRAAGQVASRARLADGAGVRPGRLGSEAPGKTEWPRGLGGARGGRRSPQPVGPSAGAPRGRGQRRALAQGSTAGLAGLLEHSRVAGAGTAGPGPHRGPSAGGSAGPPSTIQRRRPVSTGCRQLCWMVPRAPAAVLAQRPANTKANRSPLTPSWVTRANVPPVRAAVEPTRGLAPQWHCFHCTASCAPSAHVLGGSEQPGSSQGQGARALAFSLLLQNVCRLPSSLGAKG